MTVQDLRAAMLAIDDAIARGGNLEDAVDRLARLKDAAKDLRELLATAEKAVIAKMDGEKRAIIAGHTVEVKTEIRRSNWQHDDLLRIVMDTRHVNPETGEIESPTETIKAVFAVKGYNARVGELKKRGIDVSDFCDVEYGAKKLRMS